jgi:hypothetical protein
MKKTIIVLLCAVILSTFGCAISQQVITPNGTPGHSLYCEDMFYCYQKAGSLCPHGYTVHSQAVVGIGFGDEDVQMLIECK